MSSIDATLAQRGSRYGEFATHATHSQSIKALLVKLMGQAKWEGLADDQREALDMISHKLGRITNGDPNYDDSWRDIAGYAQLVAKRLAPPEAKPAMSADEAELRAKLNQQSPKFKNALQQAIEESKANQEVEINAVLGALKEALGPDFDVDKVTVIRMEDMGFSDDCDCPACTANRSKPR